MVKLQDYTATEKDEVSLDCELSKDVPVMWYHSEKEIIASKMVVMKSEGTRRSLVLKRVEQSDRGVYVCDCGTDKTSANITIEGEVSDCDFVVLFCTYDLCCTSVCLETILLCGAS